MRTTLTLDSDVKARLERLRSGSRGIKTIINEALRLGLDRMEQADGAGTETFETPTFKLGAKRASLDNIAEVLATAEDEDWR
jgi:hypothetical protein